MSTLSSKKCVPCEGGVPPLTSDQIKPYLAQVDEKWQVVENKKIRREFKFKDFAGSMKFVNAMADIAEAEGHHPDFHVHWNKVLVEIWSHEIGGLSENDFILASKIDQLRA